MAITLLEKKTGIVSDLQQAVFNRISTDAQDGYVEGYLNEFAITKLSANSLSVDTGMVSLQGFRVVNDTITNVYVGVSAATPIDMELVAKLTIVLASENNNVELIARPSQTPTQDNVFAQGEGVYEAVLASFVVDQNGIRDIKRGVGKIDIEQSDIKEIEKQMALKADKAALAITDANVALKADKTSLDVTNTLVATKADQKDLDATNTLVATKADKVALEATNANVALKANQKDLDATNTLVATKADKVALEAAKLVNVTWQELKDLRDSSALVPGRQHRITDYVTTTAQENTRSAGHQFDIIVTADDVDVLNENARAVQHEGDTYFANSKLEAWKLKYCLDNDTSRFAWADTENGKGIIYRMIDEFNNDVPYDFKNIQFKRKITDGEFDLDSGIDTWVYTFTGFSYENNTLVDGTTLKASEYFSDEGSNLYKNNVIGIYEVSRLQEDGFDNILETLSDNVFIGRYNEVPYVEDGPAKLVLFSFNNNLGRDCYSNTFGNDCYGNTFGNSCNQNTFGGSCSDNTFGNDCGSNTFGDGCRSNTFGGNCYYNTFGNSCGSNTFGGNCSDNTFGNDCDSNTFGNDCRSNTFGGNCYYNTFGNSCRYLQISDVSTTAKRYISVENGTNGASSANKFDLYDLAMANKGYQVTFKKSASGKYLMLWATDTGTMTGKVKATSITPAWSDIV